MKIGQNIKTLRIRKGLKQKDLAEKLNVTPQAVSRWELDTAEPELDTIKKMANLFEVTMDELTSEDLCLEKEVEEQEEAVEPEVCNTQEQLPIVGVCSICEKPIHAGEGEQRTSRGGKITYICDECLAKQKADADATFMYRFKRRRLCAYIFSPILGVAIFALFLALTLVQEDQTFLTGGIIFSVVAGILGFTTLFTIIMKNTFIGEMWMDIATWGFVKFPGIIFGLNFDGIVFLILTKILFFILGILLVLGAITLATVLAAVCSIFAFPFSIYWAHKKPEKTDLD